MIDEKKEKKLIKMGITINLINYDIDIKNYKNPIVYSIYNLGQNYSPLNIIVNHLNLEPLKIISYEGLIFDSIKANLFIKYEQNKKQVWNTEKEIIGSFYFWSKIIHLYMKENIKKTKYYCWFIRNYSWNSYDLLFFKLDYL